MNRKTEQLNVCKAMLDSSRNVAYCELPNDTIAVTTDGLGQQVGLFLPVRNPRQDEEGES